MEITFFIEVSFKTRKAVCQGDVLQGRLLYSKAPETTYACVSVRVGAIYAPESAPLHAYNSAYLNQGSPPYQHPSHTPLIHSHHIMTS